MTVTEGSTADRLVCEIVHGATAWSELAENVDALQDRLDTPITARRRWLDTWLACYSEFSPAVVAVYRANQLVGLAPLASTTSLGVTHYVPMGHGPSDLVEFSATDDEVSRTVAAGIVKMMAERSNLWSLTAKNVVSGSPVLGHLQERLPIVEVCPGDVLPQMHFDEVRELRKFVSRNHHQQVNRLRNKAKRDGLMLETEHIRGQQLMSVLEDLIEIQAKRELDAGRRLKTRDANDGAFLRQIISVHAEADLVEATVLRIDGVIGAFTLDFIDGAARRLWTLAFDPAYRDYGIGRLCVDATIERALSTPECTEYDFMKGDESYKRTFANHVVECVELFAWSSPAVRVAFDSGRTIRLALKERSSSDPRIEWIVDAGMRLRTSWWHRSSRREAAVGSGQRLNGPD